MSPRFGCRVRRAAFGVAALSCAMAALALDPARSLSQHSLQSWQNGQGLPQNSIQAMLQGQDGYLWIATQDGLVRFDGVRFTILDPTNTPGLKRGDIRSLLQDREGALWVATYGGGVVRMAGGEVRPFTTRDGLPNDSVITLCQDPEGGIWAGTETGLCRIQGTAQVRAFRAADGLPSEDISTLWADPDGSVWIGTSRGLARWSGGRILPVPLPWPGEPYILSLYRDRAGRFWVGTRRGLAASSGKGFELLQPKPGRGEEEIWSLLEDRAGNFWVGTGDGLCRFRNGAWERLSVQGGLTYPVVRSLLEDAEGSLWVGTSSGGLNRLKDGSFLTYTVAEGLSGDFVWCVHEDRAGDLWVGTDLAGLNRLHEGRFDRPGAEVGLNTDEITALGSDREGNLWVGGRDFVAVREGGRWRRITAADGLPRGRIRTFLAPAPRTVWVATHGGGIAVFEGGRFVRAYTEADGLPTRFVRTLHQAADGVIWVGMSGSGLCRFEGGRFKPLPGVPDGAYIMSVYEDAGGGLWFPTSGQGLLYFRDGRLTVLGEADGMPDETLFQVLEDDEGRLWISCNKGIFRFERAAAERRAAGAGPPVTSWGYGVADGLASAECNGGAAPAGIRTRDGRLWFPTVKGLAVLDPRHLRSNPVPPPVLVETFLAGGHPVPGDGAVVAPGTRNFEFRYTALSFLAPERVLFQYRLEGYEEAWVDAGTRRTAYYTSLPPGRCAFRVRACNSDGVWNDAGASLSFRLRPRLDQMTPVRVALALVAGLVLYGLFRWRVRRLKHREAELETAVTERTSELQKVNAELERLASTDGLTGLVNHRAFHDLLVEEWRRCCREGEPLSVVLADIDHFKRYNDARGHLEGDRALRRVADALAGACHRPGDSVARYGGEEFAAILPATHREGALHVAEEMRRAVEAVGEAHPDSEVAPVVTVSLGVATVHPSPEGRPSDLLAKTDEALYRAKAAGRNRVEMD